MHEEAVFEALSSKPRMDILKQLYRQPLGIQELSKKLKLQPITIRHHVHSLLKAGLLETHEKRSGVAGRPKNYYQISKSLPLISFPERRYLTLSSSLLSALRANLSEQEVKKILAKIGRDLGVEAVKQLEKDFTIDNWSPEAFQRFFIEEYLEGMGAEPEVTVKTSNSITYRLHNCIFYEIAQSMPNMMCDVLHHQFHVGVMTAIGKHVKDKQTTCMGHGDNYCEHTVEWHN